MTHEQQIAEEVAQMRKYRRKAHAAQEALGDVMKRIHAVMSQPSQAIPARPHEADATLDDLRQRITDELKWDTNHRLRHETTLVTGTVVVEYDNEWVVTGQGPDNTRWKATYVGSDSATRHTFEVEQI